MKQTLSRWAVLAAGAAGLLVSSCAYDPYYDGGYGYSGGSYSSSVFISTGDSRWGYDPSCNSYYDYTRRAYYDPFLYGYYPVGYRPPIVYGMPHPHGWRPGMRHCPPPSRVRSYNLSNYRDREGAYRRGNFSWAREVRQRDQGSNFNPRDRDNRPRGGSDSRREDFRRDSSRDRDRDDNRFVRRDFPGQQQERPSFDRDRSSDRTRENFLQQRREMEQRSRDAERSRQMERSRQIERSRESDRSRGNFDRSQFQNRGREQRPSPTFNNPVTIPTPRSEPQRDRGSEMRQRFEQRGGGESRQRSENQGRTFRGGGGENRGGERRDRR